MCVCTMALRAPVCQYVALFVEGRDEGRTLLEGRTEGGLRGGALSTLEAMVVSMGFMAPSVAMFFNTPFIAGFAGGAMPLAMLLSFAAVFLVALGFSQLASRTASAGSVYAIVSNAINPKTGFMGMWFFLTGNGIFEPAPNPTFAPFPARPR